MIFAPSISIIGLGNVGYHMAVAFQHAGISIDQIYNRSQPSDDVRDVLKSVKIIDSFTDLLPSSDIYIIAVRDDAIASVVKQLQLCLPKTSLLCHISGSISIDVFAPFFKDYGTIYPLQSFSIADTIDWSSIPIIVSASSERTGDKLASLSTQLSDHIHRYTDEQRQAIHLSAVIANNFTNALIGEANRYLLDQDIDPTILNPLLIKTIEKLKTLTANEAQTGPAIRGDHNTIEKHLNKLKDDPNLTEIYRLMSNLINPDLNS